MAACWWTQILALEEKYEAGVPLLCHTTDTDTLYKLKLKKELNQSIPASVLSHFLCCR